MTKYIITKQGKEFKRTSIYDIHTNIIKDNGLTYYDVIDEGYIIEGRHFSNRGQLPIDLLRAREVESRYSYDRYRQGLREGD